MGYIDTTRTSTTIAVSGVNGEVATVLSSNYRTAICSDGYATGKRYFEVKILTKHYDSTNWVGLCDSAGLTTDRPGYGSARALGLNVRFAKFYRNSVEIGTVTGNPLSIAGGFMEAGEVAAVAVDLDTGEVWMGATNTGNSAINWGAVGASNSDPGAGVSPVATDAAIIGAAMFPCAQCFDGGTVYEFHLAPGDMDYPIPTGFSAWLSASRIVLRGDPLVQPYDLLGDPLSASLSQPWVLFDAIAAGLEQPWGLRMSRDLVEPWANAPVRVAGLAQPWRDAGELARGLVQPWQDAAPLAAGLAQAWDILAPLAAGLVQPWAIAGDAALVGPLAQGWDLRDVVPLSVDLAQPWTIGTDPALLRYTLGVTIDGHQVQVDSLTLEADLDQDAIHCTLSLGDLAGYLRCRDLAPVVVRVAVNGGAAEEYRLVQTSARIDERHGETRYEVQAESALVLLGEPYAQPVETEEYTGPASVIAATLCAPLTLAWQTVDWTLPSGALVAAGETPLQLLKRLAASVGAVVQALPDGSVRVVPEYPISLPAWPTATPDMVWIETERSEQVAGQPERRVGYNKYLVGETLTAADSLRLEEETISEAVKLVRGYQVPWTGLFALVHTGGSWVQVEDLGIETRQETETIEIVAGEGRVRYPILRRDAVRWLHVSLGALTVSEDGTVRADVAGQSLCEITYTTRCRKWRVRDGRNESLQLVAEI